MNNIKKLKYDKKLGLYVGKAYILPFDTELEVIVDEDVEIVYVEKCIEYINNLPQSLLNKISERAYKYYDFIRNECGDVDDILPEKIMEHVYPLNIFVEKPEADIPAFDIECGCDWEEEHGMEIIIKGDELLYIGEYAGLGPWADKECYKTVF